MIKSFVEIALTVISKLFKKVKKLKASHSSPMLEDTEDNVSPNIDQNSSRKEHVKKR